MTQISRKQNKELTRSLMWDTYSSCRNAGFMKNNCIFQKMRLQSLCVLLQLKPLLGLWTINFLSIFLIGSLVQKTAFEMWTDCYYVLFYVYKIHFQTISLFAKILKIIAWLEKILRHNTVWIGLQSPDKCQYNSLNNIYKNQ